MTIVIRATKNTNIVTVLNGIPLNFSEVFLSIIQILIIKTLETLL